jgi:type VI secretion system protein ImpC
LDFVITDLRFNINLMLNQLIHDKSLQALESAWRGLYWLVKTADGHPLCKIDMLPVHKDILREDISARTDLVETHFFELLYINEYGQYGGEPYGAVVFDFGFEHSKEDIDFLQQLAQIGRFAHAPIFAAANPSFFGLERFEDLPNIDSLEELQQGARFKYWKKFQESQEAAYLLLTLPKVLLRSSYSFAKRNVSSTLYNEDISRLASNCLWGSAAFAFAVNCLESFKKYGTCSELVGPEEGAVNGLDPVRIFEDEAIAPVQVLLSERKEAELVRLGFAPLSVIKSQSKLVFYSANSLRWGYCCAQPSSFQDQHLDQVLSAQFPYAFIILRIAQYLKVITRDFVGSTHNVSELETLLDNWLRAYVSDVENPPADVRARRPLKKVVLTMSPSAVQPGWYHTEIHITPHTKYLGRYFDLSLDFDVPIKQGMG